MTTTINNLNINNLNINNCPSTGSTSNFLGYDPVSGDVLSVIGSSSWSGLATSELNMNGFNIIMNPKIIIKTDDTNSIALGFDAGITQGESCVAIGNSTGNNQGNGSIAIGNLAGGTQAENCVAIGQSAGNISQPIGSVAIGTDAMKNSISGAYSVAIGFKALDTPVSYDNIIVLNGTGESFPDFVANPINSGNRFYVKPIREEAFPYNNTTEILNYDYASGEVFYSSPSFLFFPSYGEFVSTVSQSLPNNVAVGLSYDSFISQGITWNAGTPKTITVTDAGTYRIQYRVQLIKMGTSGSTNIYCWIKKQNNNIDSSSSYVYVPFTPNTGNVPTSFALTTIAVSEFIVTFTAGQIFEIWCQCSISGAYAYYNAGSPPDIPDAPSIITTINRIY